MEVKCKDIHQWWANDIGYLDWKDERVNDFKKNIIIKENMGVISSNHCKSIHYYNYFRRKEFLLYLNYASQ